MKLKLRSPAIITPRLMPGVQVGKGFISIGYAGERGGRTVYEYHIDVGRKSYSNDDLSSGVGGGDLQGGLTTLLAFLSAAAESHSYHMRVGRRGENESLFPEWVNEWAYQHDDEISMLQSELEERPGLIKE